MRRVALITGATGAIGFAIARQLAEIPGQEVVLACRDEARGTAAVEKIKKTTGSRAVRCELVNLSRFSSIHELAGRWQGPLHLLINNAAQSPRARKETPEGLELQFATNVMGYFWMTREFAPMLEQAAPSRIVNVASYWAGGLDLDDLQFTRRPYDNDAVYRQSKQANRMLTVAFASRLRERGISVNVCHPGDVNSRLSNDLGFGGHETPDDGAATPVWLATEEIGEKVTGQYFEHRKKSACRFGADSEAVEALFDACSVL